MEYHIFTSMYAEILAEKTSWTLGSCAEVEGLECVHRGWGSIDTRGFFLEREGWRETGIVERRIEGRWVIEALARGW